MRVSMLTILLLILHAAQAPAQGFSYPPRRHGEIEARLEVQVADQSAGPGLGEVMLTLIVTGPITLEVETPRLEDSIAAWKLRWNASGWVRQDGGCTWSETFPLQQVKPGPLAVPGLKVRFRSDPSNPWIEESWLDILRDPRDSPPPEGMLPADSSRTVGILMAILIPALAVLLAAAWGYRRYSRAPAPPLTPAQRALQELARLEAMELSGPEESERFHTQLSNLVRRYLAERFGLRAPQQTTLEFLQEQRREPRLSADQERLLGDFLSHCDLAKFALAANSVEECRRMASLARNFVEQTAEAPTQ
jgi:hypothetical protein